MNLQMDDKIGSLKSSISNMFVRNQDLVQVDSSMRVKALSEINELNTMLQKAKKHAQQSKDKDTTEDVPCDIHEKAHKDVKKADAIVKAVDGKVKSHEKKEKAQQKEKASEETGKADESLGKLTSGPKEQVSAKKTEHKTKDTLNAERAHSKSVHKHRKEKKAKEDEEAVTKVKKARARDVKRRKGEPLAKKDAVDQVKDEADDEKAGEAADLESWRALNSTPEHELDKQKPKDGMPELAPKEINFKKSKLAKGAVDKKKAGKDTSEVVPCDTETDAKQAVKKADAVVKADEADNKKISKLVKAAAKDAIEKVTDASTKALAKQTAEHDI